MGLRARTLHETGNWLVMTKRSKAFNTVNRAAVLAEVANYVPALALKTSGRVLSDGFRRDQDQKIACSNGVQQGNAAKYTFRILYRPRNIIPGTGGMTIHTYILRIIHATKYISPIPTFKVAVHSSAAGQSRNDTQLLKSGFTRKLMKFFWEVAMSVL